MTVTSPHTINPDVDAGSVLAAAAAHGHPLPPSLVQLLREPSAATEPVSGAPAPASFGTLPDGRPVDAYRLANGVGMSVTVLTYGGIVQSLDVPDRYGDGRPTSCSASATLEDYVLRGPYFGAIIGRFANRIADGRFELDGVESPAAGQRASDQRARG